MEHSQSRRLFNLPLDPHRQLWGATQEAAQLLHLLVALFALLAVAILRNLSAALLVLLEVHFLRHPLPTLLVLLAVDFLQLILAALLLQFLLVGLSHHPLYQPFSKWKPTPRWCTQRNCNQSKIFFP